MFSCKSWLRKFATTKHYASKGGGNRTGSRQPAGCCAARFFIFMVRRHAPDGFRTFRYSPRYLRQTQSANLFLPDDWELECPLTKSISSLSFLLRTLSPFGDSAHNNRFLEQSKMCTDWGVIAYGILPSIKATTAVDRNRLPCMLPKLFPLAFVAKLTVSAQVLAVRAKPPRAPHSRTPTIPRAVEHAMPHVFRTILGGYS